MLFRSTATALEVLRMTEESDLEPELRAKGAYFLQQLQALKSRWKMIGQVDGMGMALRIEMCREDGYTPNRELADRVFNEGLKGDLDAGGRPMGLVLDIGGYYKNVFTLAPSFTITREEIDLGIALIEHLEGDDPNALVGLPLPGRHRYADSGVIASTSDIAWRCLRTYFRQRYHLRLQPAWWFDQIRAATLGSQHIGHPD